MCSFGPVRTSLGLTGGLCKKILSMCPRGLIIALFCRIHGLNVHVPVWSSQIALGPRRERSLKFPPSPLFATEKNVSQQTECIEMM